MFVWGRAGVRVLRCAEAPRCRWVVCLSLVARLAVHFKLPAYNPHTFPGPTSLDDHVLRYAAVEESALVMHRHLDVKNKGPVWPASQ